jgi:uncharacterized protein with ParB-like and HNH nuclease domain
MNEQENIDVIEEENNDFYSDDDLFKIQSWGADLSFRELISRYDDDELVKPELQRNYVWDKSEASRFIDSILLGLPIPSIFLAKTENEKLLIIDGYQRLMTVRDYVKGTFTKDSSLFRLSKIDKIHERWRGKSFLELSDEDKRKIRNTTIHAIIFNQQHPTNDDTSLYQIFERINSSGRTLLAQEIRNCVYQGPLNSLLIRLNENEKWRLLFGTARRDDRMRDMEYILRFFALSSADILDESKSPASISLKKHLNKFMGIHNKPQYIENFESKFIRMVDFVYSKFGSSAFHNISQTTGNTLSGKFSPTIFDAISISTILALENPNLDINGNFQQRKLELLTSEGYQQALSQETMRTANIRLRVNRALSHIYRV